MEIVQLIPFLWLCERLVLSELLSPFKLLKAMCANAVVRQLVNFLCRLALVVVLIRKGVLVLLGTLLRAPASSAHTVHHGEDFKMNTVTRLNNARISFQPENRINTTGNEMRTRPTSEGDRRGKWLLLLPRGEADPTNDDVFFDKCTCVPQATQSL